MVRIKAVGAVVRLAKREGVLIDAGGLAVHRPSIGFGSDNLSIGGFLTVLVVKPDTKALKILRGFEVLPGLGEVGSAMHRAASRFAIDAQNAAVTGDLKPALGALSEVINGCVGCHAGYRLR